MKKKEKVQKDKQFADCPKCKARCYHKNIVRIVKCNACGYQRRPDER